MTREQLPSEADRFFGKIHLREDPDGATHLPDHTRLYPTDQPGNGIGLTDLQTKGDATPADRKVRFGTLLRRLQARDI